jgi:polyisoprenyl-teichoic acid--peptidoglycan teichoic acid transferase
MPIKENDDFQRRFRTFKEPSRRPPIMNDIQSVRPNYRAAGVAAPSPVQPQLQRLRPVPVRSQQPVARRPLRDIAPQAQAPEAPIMLDEAAAQIPETPADAIPRFQRQRLPQQPQQEVKPTAGRRRLWRRFINGWTISICISLLILGGAIFIGMKFVGTVQRVFHGSVFSVLTSSKLKGEDSGKVNILVAGNSADDVGHNGAELTDSIMMVTIDVKNNTAMMTSIPRDLWVNIPGFGHAKINEAYVDGKNSNFSAPGYPNGGMGLLASTIEQALGIKEDYYALVNYNALRDAVNAVGGVDFTVQSSDPRGLYDPSIDYATKGPLVKLTNGVHHLDGEQALDLSRARGDAYGSYGFPRSDFDRTEHQRQLVLALKEKILTAGTLTNPVALGGLFDSVGKNVQTDFTLGEVCRLYEIGKNITNGNIVSVGLNDVNGINLLSNYTSPTGQSALTPALGMDDFSAIRSHLAQLMSSDPVVREAARVVILNGAGKAGLAAQTQTYVIGKGLSVAAIGDAKTTVPATTIIIVSPDKTASLALLKTIFGAQTATTTSNPYASAYQADFIVVLGGDWTVPAATTTP